MFLPIFMLQILVIATLVIAEDILDLSGYDVEEFKNELQNYDVMFIKFFAPYCSRCKSIEKDFNKAAATMAEDKPSVQFAKVDCSSGLGSKVCEEFNAASFPALKLFKHGVFKKDYEGSKDSDTFVEWLKKNAHFVTQRFKSFSELNKQISKANEPAVIAIFNNNDDPLLEQWFKATEKVKRHWNYREVEFLHIFEEFSTGNSGLLTSIGLSDKKMLRAPTIILHRPPWLHNSYEASDVVYSVESKEDLEQWIKRKAFGIVLWRTRDNEEELKPPLIVAYYDMDFKQDPSFAHLWRNRIAKAALANPELSFAISNSQTFRKQLRRQNLEPPRDKQDPLVVGYDIFGVMYVMRDKFTVKNFGRYIEDFKKGDVAPHLKSEDPVTDNDERDVKVVVAATFPQMISFTKKDVFIAFYAPWCIHSKEMLPIWDELGRQLKNEPNLEIAKMDAVANEVPKQFEVPQYPTIYFVSGKTKKTIRYSGGRYIHELVMFLAAHTSVEMKGYTRDGTIRKQKQVKSEFAKVVEEVESKIDAQMNAKIEL
ncbi:Protein disulfide-isomerase A3-like protein [Leptotrombidium deliense]|uniref:protein disulfide-isomerase n=1 Tax=Leptotrombidium deliense TaxID=299467 RepID=A0A443SMX3_9ACAR|nr:Protein disulfide-isomerase A3-like protein [Leptotrombidium deliense]